MSSTQVFDKQQSSAQVSVRSTKMNSIKRFTSPDHEEIETSKIPYLMILFFVHVGAQWQQYFFTYVRQGDNPKYNFQLDLGMSGAQYGLVSGTVFTATNSISGIIMGYQVDKFNRKYLLIGCSLVWNLICVTMYWTDSFYMLVFIRIGFAIVSSVHTPCCISLINDFFQHENRAKANSVYVAAISVGVGFANLTSFINEAVGWRDSILIVSGIGLIATMLIFFMEEPLRQADRGTQELMESKVEQKQGKTAGIDQSRKSRLDSILSRQSSEANLFRTGTVKDQTEGEKADFTEIQPIIEVDMKSEVSDSKKNSNISQNKMSEQTIENQYSDRIKLLAQHESNKTNLKGSDIQNQNSQDLDSHGQSLADENNVLSPVAQRQIMENILHKGNEPDINEKFPIEQEDDILITERTMKSQKWKTNFFVELTPLEKVGLLVTNKAYMLLLCAALFRFAGGYSLGFWAKQYFSGVYPEYDDQYTTLYFLILIFGGIPSELMGGYICDKYEPRYPSIKGFISAAGAFLGSICILFTFIFPSNFYLQMVAYYFEYLTAEVFFGPSYAQINKIVSGQIQGLAVAIFMLTGAFSGSLITYFLGYLGDYYDIKTYPERQGYLLGITVLISYWGCIPFFILNGIEYAKQIKYQKQILKQIVRYSEANDAENKETLK